MHVVGAEAEGGAAAIPPHDAGSKTGQLPMSVLMELHEIRAVGWAIAQLGNHNPDLTISNIELAARLAMLGSVIEKKAERLTNEEF